MVWNASSLGHNLFIPSTLPSKPSFQYDEMEQMDDGNFVKIKRKMKTTFTCTVSLLMHIVPYSVVLSCQY